MYPVANPVISLDYGVKGKLWQNGWHDGVDFKCRVGTPVYAARRGVIAPQSWGKAYGIHIVQRRTFPFRTKNHLIYAHLSRSLVKPGQKVKKGEMIGLSGDTGNTTGPHLHFGERNGPTWSGSSPVNPHPTLEA